MDFFATQAFQYAGVTVAEGDDVGAVFDRRTIGHMLVAGWVTAVPEPAV